jgi:type I restriction-modification system DNA methylase subunit
MRVGSRGFSRPECEPLLARDARKAAGVYYTPPEVVRLIVELTLAPQSSCTNRAPTILDIACGAGEFLLEAFRFQCTRHGNAAARRSVRGVDIDPGAVESARRRLQEIDRAFPAANIRAGDALEEEPLAAGTIDAIVGNPPYVNIRQLAKATSPERMQRLRERFCTARGNFDLYVLFIERALELLRPGGRCGLIVPNKWATLDYARPCREVLLSQTTIEHVIDLSGERVFAGASVYPQVLIFRKQRARAGHAIGVRDFGCRVSRSILQGQLSAESISLAETIEVESRVATQPLGEVAALVCGTAGYSAQKIARRLVDAKDAMAAQAENLADFITSGNIDRYSGSGVGRAGPGAGGAGVCGV